MRGFRDLRVWKGAHELVLMIHEVSRTFPQNERFGLTSQIRRAAASIPANIGEACGRDGDGEMLRFLRISMGSATETEYHLMLAHDLGFLTSETYKDLNERLGQVKKMLNAFTQKVKTDRQRVNDNDWPPNSQQRTANS